MFEQPDDRCASCGHTLSQHLFGVVGGECLFNGPDPASDHARRFCSCEGFVRIPDPDDAPVMVALRDAQEEARSLK
jgi:hypothetical protein